MSTDHDRPYTCDVSANAAKALGVLVMIVANNSSKSEASSRQGYLI